MATERVEVPSRKLGDLQDHPLNALLPRLSDSEYAELRESIAAKGILVPLCVTPAGVILCGHHRARAAREVGLTVVPAWTRDLSEPEQVVHLIDDNVQRRQLTPSQKAALVTAPEYLAAHEAIAKAARARQREGQRAGGREGGRGRPKVSGNVARDLLKEEKGRPREQLAKVAGVSARTIEDAKLGWRDDPESMRAILQEPTKETTKKGSTKPPTVSRVAHEIRRKEKATEAERAIERGQVEFEEQFRLQRYDVWNFQGLDPGFGRPWPGNIPASLVANVLYYLTEPGALVVDPMAGGGVTGDVCRVLGRTCVMADMNPCPERSDVARHDFTTGAVPGTEGQSNLVFLDPPYWTLKAKEYANVEEDWDAWCGWLGKIAKAAVASLAPGGHVTVLMQDNLTKDVAHGRLSRPNIATTLRAFESVGLTEELLIAVPLSTQQVSPRDMEIYRLRRRILGVLRLLLVFRI